MEEFMLLELGGGGVHDDGVFASYLVGRDRYCLWNVLPLFIVHCSLFVVRCSLFIVPCSLFLPLFCSRVNPEDLPRIDRTSTTCDVCNAVSDFLTPLVFLPDPTWRYKPSCSHLLPPHGLVRQGCILWYVSHIRSQRVYSVLSCVMNKDGIITRLVTLDICRTCPSHRLIWY